MVVPAFLTEDLFFFVNIRIEYRIQIYMHQILEIPVITACYRVAGLIRIGHGIKEGIKRTFYQLHKRILKRKFPGAAQYAVFQDVGNTGAVLWRCTECNVKNFILIAVLDEHDSGSCFFVFEKPSFGMNILKIFFLQDFICVQMIGIHKLVTS